MRRIRWVRSHSTALGGEPLKPDLVLVLTYVTISAIGLLMIFSATAPGFEAAGEDPATELRSQAIWVVLGFIVFAVASTINLVELKGFASPFYLVSVVLLVLVFPLGESDGVAQRWIDLGRIQFQPSEFAKIAVILMIASILAAAERPIKWNTVAHVLVIVGVPAGLIFLQPDLGTMLVFAAVTLALLFVGGATLRQLGFLFVATVVGTVGLFQLKLIEDYQIRRLTAFIDPESHSLDATYNQVQSEIAIGSGGFFGKGLFEGTQTNLQFVPVQSSDFIFTAVGEQFGFVGSVIVIALFGVLLFRLVVIAMSARSRFAFLVTMGVAAMLAFHIFVNIGMTVRIMPVTGLPLPFMSAGGTVFVALSAALGLAHSAWIRRNSPVGE
ncbi:MAG: rod shape-determining protein RodA [Actinomycetota bacterium]|nr:rod shape-determining protein RodA [Actinomycetota bacterium]MDK1026679.1 rod shape-determining protein RodA [Actinomycetota bacterium]MDK1096442.1 rod shape-determining protein RodA [Actinomycetota bacterium]MDK1103716.1 rod shape-determining protein RodA [Actinomycetota bacterium]MDK1291463.1 rod shape-determining protein RodA [Actinomycetota bacterium]